MVATAKTGAKTGVDRALLLVEVLAGLGVVAAIIGKTYGVAPTIFFVLCGFAASFTGFVLVRSALAWKDATLDLTHQVRDEERERLEQEKLILLQGIKELESDLAIGKVDPRDYAHLRRTAENRAIAIIEKLKTQDSYWRGQAEALVASRLGTAIPTSGRAAGETSSAEEAPAAEASAGEMVARSRVLRAGPKISWVAIETELARKEPADVSLFDDRPVTLDGRCSGCGTDAAPDARYCVQCGRPRV